MTLKSLLTLYSNTLQYWYMALYCIVLLHGNARQCMALKVHHSSACTVVLCTACASLEWSSAAQRSESHAVWETAPVANYFICPGGLSWIQQEEVVRIYIAAGENAESWRNTSFDLQATLKNTTSRNSPSAHCSQLLHLPRRTVLDPAGGGDKDVAAGENAESWRNTSFDLQGTSKNTTSRNPPCTVANYFIWRTVLDPAAGGGKDITAGENAESWRNTSFSRGLWRISHPKKSPSPCSQLLPLPRRTVNCMLAARGNQVFC